MARGSFGIEGEFREQGRKEAEVKKNVRSLLVVILVCFLAVLITGKALAAGSWSYYDLTVDPFGGTAITSNLQKAYNGSCTVNSISVGGDYDLWAYLERLDNTVVSTKQLINDDTLVQFANTASAGQSVHMTFQSGLIDTVHIEAIGYWSPDTP